MDRRGKLSRKSVQRCHHRRKYTFLRDISAIRAGGTLFGVDGIGWYMGMRPSMGIGVVKRELCLGKPTLKYHIQIMLPYLESVGP